MATGYNDVDQWVKRFAEHEIEEVTPKTRSFKLSFNNEHNMSCLVTFTDEGITISGDICPTHPGTTSCRGYGIKWFGGALSPSYLSEKFLRERFIPQQAALEMKEEDSWVRESIRWNAEGNQSKIDSNLRELDEIIIACEAGEMEPMQLADELHNVGLDVCEGLPGWGYDPTEVGILVGIQRRFSELYQQGAIKDGD